MLSKISTKSNRMQVLQILVNFWSIKQYASKIGKELKVDKLTVDNSETPLQEPLKDIIDVNHKKDAV